MTIVRVSNDDVNAIMDKDISDIDIGAFITVANLMVDNKLTGKGVSEDLMYEIQRWLAAHFVAVKYKDERVEQEKIDVASVKYMSMSAGSNALDMTPYGRQEKLLDPTGSFVSEKQAHIDMFGATHNDIADVNA